MTIWPTAGNLLIFLFGFLSSKGVDMVLNNKDLKRMMGVNNLINERKVEIRTASAGWGTGVEEEDVPTAASVIAPGAAAVTLQVDASPAANAPSATTATAESGFDSIVKTAYTRALKPRKTQIPRRKFNVTWWVAESGLTTTGGLNKDDRALLGQLYYNASSVFEYGLGESTYIANYVGVPRYSGIDSDPQWVGMARDKVASHFRFYLGDIGQTKAWGYPKDPKQRKNVLNYQLSPLIVEPQPFDVYMVDGRWRLPALIASFLHASDRGASHAETIVLIHDCDVGNTTGRVEYKRADHLLKLVQHSGNKLCVYQRRQETTDNELKDLWHTYMDELGRR